MQIGSISSGYCETCRKEQYLLILSEENNKKGEYVIYHQLSACSPVKNNYIYCDSSSVYEKVTRQFLAEQPAMTPAELNLKKQVHFLWDAINFANVRRVFAKRLWYLSMQIKFIFSSELKSSLQLNKRCWNICIIITVANLDCLYATF